MRQPTRPERPGKRDRTQQQICSAARDVFAEHGVSSATMEQIASVAGVRRSTLYNHFGDKDEILWAIAEQFGDGLVEIIALLPSRPSPREIDRWLEEVMRFTAGHKAPTILLLQLGAAFDAPQAVHSLGAKLLQALADRIPAFRHAVEPGVQQGLASARASAVMRQIGAACTAYIRAEDPVLVKNTAAVAGELLGWLIDEHSDPAGE